MKTNSIFFLVFPILISGCANSASHTVMQINKASDIDLSCKEIRIEKAKAQSVIDAVQQDKGDMTGADVMDGILWFPFNVIAKQSNYSEAVKAAEQRIEHLRLIEKENGCKRKQG